MAKQQDKIKEFSQMSKEALLVSLREKKEKLCQLGFDLTAGRVKNVREIRTIKKDIARVSTLLKIKS